MGTEIETERKFVITGVPEDADWPVEFQDSLITQIYLQSQEPGVAERVRMRKFGRFMQGPYTHAEYTHTVKRHLGPGQNEETERSITAEEFEAVEDRPLSHLGTVVKRRRVFGWGGHVWELDDFFFHTLTTPSLRVLEVELDDLTETLVIPPFLQFGDEVTDDFRYTNKHMAEHGPPR